MIDIHSHILPGIDDGAKNTDDSQKLLKQMSEQGVTTAVATPHFYPDVAVLEDFIAARENSAKTLLNSLNSDYNIKILLGAEVFYFKGMGGFEDIRKLTISNSRYLLVELLGMKKIEDKVIKDITDLKDNFGIMPIIAHVERYSGYKDYKKLLSVIRDGNALCQINASFFFSFKDRRAVKKLIKEGLVSFIASDCHSPVNRPVHLTAALSAIRNISEVQFRKIIKNTENIEEELLSAYGEQNG